MGGGGGKGNGPAVVSFHCWRFRDHGRGEEEGEERKEGQRTPPLPHFTLRERQTEQLTGPPQIMPNNHVSSTLLKTLVNS